MEIARCKSEKRTPAGASGVRQDVAVRHRRLSKTEWLTSLPTVEHQCAIFGAFGIEKSPREFAANYGDAPGGRDRRWACLGPGAF